jgi:hypothetical protein
MINNSQGPWRPLRGAQNHRPRRLEPECEHRHQQDECLQRAAVPGRVCQQVVGHLCYAEHVDEVEEQVEWRHVVLRDRPTMGLEGTKIIYHKRLLREHFSRKGLAELRHQASRGALRISAPVTGAARTMGRMEVGHYEVEIIFEVIRPVPAPPLASIVQRIEQLLPEGSAVKSVTRGTAHEELGGIDVTLRSTSPAMALRDVASALEVVASEKNETLREFERATITRVPAVSA